MGKRGRGWRDLAVLIAHFTSTPRPVVGSYTLRAAKAERDAIYRVMKVLHGKPNK